MSINLSDLSDGAKADLLKSLVEDLNWVNLRLSVASARTILSYMKERPPYTNGTDSDAKRAYTDLINEIEDRLQGK